MVKTYKDSVICLPQSVFHHVPLSIIPSRPVVFEQATRITRVGVNAPISVTDAISCYEIGYHAQILLIVATIEFATPLTDEQRSDILFLNIEPGIAPIVIIESLLCKVLFKPRLTIHTRTILMWRIDQLTLILAQIYRILFCITKVSTPPSTKSINRFDTFYHDK